MCNCVKNQIIWDGFCNPFDKTEYLELLNNKTIHQLVIEKKIINDLEIQILNCKAYLPKEQNLLLNRFYKLLDTEYPIDTDLNKKINRPIRHLNGHAIKVNFYKENSYKVTNKETLFTLIDSLIEQKKTYNPNEKIKCECDGTYTKSNYVSHIKTKKHLLYLTSLTECQKTTS
jgi:hypothetical protein